MTPLRTIFMGTAELACASLRALHAAGDIEVIAVVTQPDRPRGRALKLQPSAVKAAALELGVPVLQPEKARHPEFVQTIRGLQPDIGVVAAYGQILPQALLDVPRLGFLNVHTSLLPKYRGAAPIQWAILDDEPQTGVTIMKMDAGLDTGDILRQESTPILREDNSATLHDRLAQIGAQLLIGTVRDYANGRITPVPQPAEGATYARKIDKQDGQLDWNLPARTLWNRVRAFSPWPGAFTWFRCQDQLRLLKILEAEPEPTRLGAPGVVIEADRRGIVIGCRPGALRVLRIQKEGGRAMTSQEFLTGNPLCVGDTLVSKPGQPAT